MSLPTGTATSIAGPTRVGNSATAATGHGRKPDPNPTSPAGNRLWIEITTPAPGAPKGPRISSGPAAVVTAGAAVVTAGAAVVTAEVVAVVTAEVVAVVSGVAGDAERNGGAPD